MKQLTETFHVLEMFGPNSTVWHKPLAGMYRPAELLAYQGRVIEAIEEAERVHLSNYGNMHGVSFRVVTTSKTVTILGGSWEQAQ